MEVVVLEKTRVALVPTSDSVQIRWCYEGFYRKGHMSSSRVRGSLEFRSTMQVGNHLAIRVQHDGGKANSEGQGTRV